MPLGLWCAELESRSGLVTVQDQLPSSTGFLWEQPDSSQTARSCLPPCLVRVVQAQVVGWIGCCHPAAVVVRVGIDRC